MSDAKMTIAEARAALNPLIKQYSGLQRLAEAADVVATYAASEMQMSQKKAGLEKEILEAESRHKAIMSAHAEAEQARQRDADRSKQEIETRRHDLERHLAAREAELQRRLEQLEAQVEQAKGAVTKLKAEAEAEERAAIHAHAQAKASREAEMARLDGQLANLRQRLAGMVSQVQSMAN